MSTLKYPISKKYKVQQSQRRYNYRKAENIKREALGYLFAYKQLSCWHTIQSDVLIDALDYLINILTKWDDKSKQLNGWQSCFLMIKTLRNIQTRLKIKFSYFSKPIKFANIEAIYQTIDCVNAKIIPINNFIFGLLIAVERHPKRVDFVKLRSIIEIMAQNQMLYLIANYPSRNKRIYRLPWERIDDPVIEYRQKFMKKREKTIKERQILQQDKKQSKIYHFFKKTIIDHDSDDEEILNLLEYLDNEN